MTDDDKLFLHAFRMIPRVGTKTLTLLREHFPTYRNAWRTSDAALANAGIPADVISAIVDARKRLDPAAEMEKISKANVWLLTETDPHYPALLKEIPHRPALLYGKGALPQQKPHIAVVGTRRPTRYGSEAAAAITQELADAGVVVVSGLATGIDTVAHRTALEANGSTLAVLGSGTAKHVIFPAENRGLAERIIASGNALISEHPPETTPRKEFFPQRNRIISGLCQGVCIIEARERSGALITARLAIEQNREVFAVPGSIFSPTSRGPHTLIQEGAKLITSARDILEELGIAPQPLDYDKSSHAFAAHEQTLLTLMENPISVDSLKEETALDTATIIAALSLLELKGIIRNLGQDMYQKT